MVVHFRVILHRNLTPCSLLIVRYSLPAQCPLIAHSFPDAIDLQVPPLMVTDGLWNGAAFQGYSAQDSHPLLIAHCQPFTTSLSSTHRPLLQHRGVPLWQITTWTLLQHQWWRCMQGWSETYQQLGTINIHGWCSTIALNFDCNSQRDQCTFNYFGN